ncbi:hypothetical protein M758_UG288700 [Ceratodon purpureus]|nr:hypothetical protein M758_UG288700 [Ceratodon purpureus]
MHTGGGGKAHAQVCEERMTSCRKVKMTYLGFGAPPIVLTAGSVGVVGGDNLQAACCGCHALWQQSE